MNGGGQERFKLADPICTFLFSVLVVGTTTTVMRDAVAVLMESTPKHIDPALLGAQLARMEGVGAVHSLHVWSLTTTTLACTVHLGTGSTDTQDWTRLQRAVTHMLRTKHGVEHVCVQVERLDDYMLRRGACKECHPHTEQDVDVIT